MKILYPPRPKGKMNPSDLPHYENGKWMAQRKFHGSRILIYISKDRIANAISRHGVPFAKFVFDKDYQSELLGHLKLEEGKEYWLDGELMNKGPSPSNHIILFDVLQAGKYLFGNPSQISRIELLSQICGNPVQESENGMALRMSSRFSMAETFFHSFIPRFKEADAVELLEGLVLRRKDAPLDNFGNKPYETTAQIRCRKPKAKSYEF